MNYSIWFHLGCFSLCCLLHVCIFLCLFLSFSPHDASCSTLKNKHIFLIKKVIMTNGKKNNWIDYFNFNNKKCNLGSASFSSVRLCSTPTQFRHCSALQLNVHFLHQMVFVKAFESLRTKFKKETIFRFAIGISFLRRLFLRQLEKCKKNSLSLV